jgi:hypothetical protein
LVLISTSPGETLAAMEEMSEGAPAPVEVPPEEPDPNDEDPFPDEPEPNEPLPDEPEPKGEDPLPVLPPEPTEGLAADDVVAVVGHTAWPIPTPATTATTTTTAARDAARPLRALDRPDGAAGAGAGAGGHPRYGGAAPAAPAPHADWGGGVQVPAGGVGGPETSVGCSPVGG